MSIDEILIITFMPRQKVEASCCFQSIVDTCPSLRSERLVSTAAAKDLKHLLEKAQNELERRNSDAETERKEAQERNEALLGRCSQLERQQRTLVEAVAAACAALQGLGVPEDLRAGGGVEEEGFRRPESLTGLQVSTGL